MCLPQPGFIIHFRRGEATPGGGVSKSRPLAVVPADAEADHQMLREQLT